MGYAPKTSTPVVPTTIINACLAAKTDPTQAALCSALKSYAKEWCKLPTRRPQFADGFFKKLTTKGRPGAKLFNGLKQEVPMVFSKSARTAGAAGSKLMGIFGGGSMTSNPGCLSGAMVQGLENMNGADHIQRKAMSASLPNSQYARYADGAMPNPNGAPGTTLIEVKGPTDSFKEFQGRDYQNVPAPHNVKIASCETCPGACDNCGC